MASGAPGDRASPDSDILARLASGARRRVERSKAALPLEAVREQALALGKSSPLPSPFEKALAAPGISFICEVKRASPSKGLIAGDFPYRQIAGDYEAAGAAAISVLTEPEFFKGSDEYLREIAASAGVPVLRKDFTVDAYQIYEARLLGASAVLLICALLETAALAAFIDCAEALGIAALVEAHDEAEVRRAREAGARIIGVNNRDLRTFRVDLSTSLRLRPLAPPGTLFVSESGIQTAEDVRALAEAGVDAVLVGEALMRAPDKAAYLAALRGGAAG